MPKCLRLEFIGGPQVVTLNNVAAVATQLGCPLLGSHARIDLAAFAGPLLGPSPPVAPAGPSSLDGPSVPAAAAEPGLLAALAPIAEEPSESAPRCTPNARNDLSFAFSRRAVEHSVDCSVDPATGKFVAPADTVLCDMTGGSELDHMRIMADCRTATPLTAEKVDAIVAAVSTAFGVRPNVIANRKRLKTGPQEPQPSDGLQDVNDYWGTDVDAALHNFTVPSSRFPGVPEERLFECWRCSTMMPHWRFSGGTPNPYDGGGHRYVGLNRVHCILAQIVLANEMTACDDCVGDFAYRPAVKPRKRRAEDGIRSKLHKRSKTDLQKRARGGDEGSRGTWMFEVQVRVPHGPQEAGAMTRRATYCHLGYIDKQFLSKQSAAEAFRAANPHMRAICKNTDWTSDMDPDTRRRYVIRKVDGVECKLAYPW